MPRTNERPSATADRKRLTAELQSRSVQLFVTLASIGDAVITTDGANSVTFLNPVAEKLTGWSLEDAVGMDIEDIFRLEDEATGAPIPSTIERAIRTVSKIVLPSDALLVTRDGIRIPVDDSAAPIVDMEGNVLGAVLVFRDITESKRAQQVIKYRSALDRMAARISTAFITSPVSEVDAGIISALREIGSFLRADRSYVILFSDDGSRLIRAYQWNSDKADPISWKTMPASVAPNWVQRLRNREYISISGIEEIPEEFSAEKIWWAERGVKTLIAVPLAQEDKVLGMVGVDSITEARYWPEDIIDLLYVIGNVFASAMQRRDAIRKLEAAREQEALIGSRIQQTLLIGEPPSAFADFRLAALTIPSSRIDGDFYDFLLHPNRVLDIIFGDVMGKGVPAALLAAGSKTEFLRSLANLLASSRMGVIPQPEEIVNSVHAVLTPQLITLESFVTLSYVRFDPSKNKLTLVDCGNTRLLRCCTGDGSLEFLSGFNVPLGFGISEIYNQAEFPFENGDLFVLYSDGVTEARSPSGEMFGLERLCNLISEKRQMTPHQIIEAMRTTIKDFVGTGTLTDDFTCVVVKIVPEQEAGLLPHMEELQVTSSLGELSIIRAFLRDFCGRREQCSLSETQMHLLELATTEVASNIMKHAYHRANDQPIWIRIEHIEDMLKILFLHRGEPFSGPEYVPMPPVDDKESGFGLFIINHSVDAIDYGLDAEGRQYVKLIKLLHRLGETDNGIRD